MTHCLIRPASRESKGLRAECRQGHKEAFTDGPARVVPVRLDETLLSAVDDQATREHVTRSDVIRTYP